MTYITQTNFRSSDPKGSTLNLTLTSPVAWKQMFESIYQCDLEQRSNNDLGIHVLTKSTISTEFEFIDFASFYKI